MPNLEIEVSAQTEAALKTNLTLRCVVRTKYRSEKSPRSAVVIPWAQARVENLTGYAVRKAGQQTAGVSAELIMIHMLGLRNIIDICYDVSLDECDPGLRNEISGKFHAKQPSHLITRKNNGFWMRRDERMDTEVFERYLQMSSKDKGPWPLFMDSKHPPVYADGKRLIEYEELTSRFLPIWETPQPRKVNEGGAFEKDKPAEHDEVGQAENPH
ncbi:hypothetical protein P170DRAFT_440711 [Aspergillus steynii IBT 23096]|uniref:Uncharacterized protein n=1 Tax=Aspergillus steynii IBT 23096 TaxID=1392250 RepID=A0A2I2FUX7_9EURO|nr:uncharacterized protein P170DRAFT_440711 [Aspergillus steynii IBT 23096]PLB44411.1 hypothetical protein P170DRAFT_440711 [Aspergillus steynii IBT 23096]